MAFVTVTNKNGDHQDVPEAWIGHPILDDGFTRLDAVETLDPEPEPDQDPVTDESTPDGVDTPKRGRKPAVKNGGHADA